MLSSDFDGFSIVDITEYLQGIGVHIDTNGMPLPPPFPWQKNDTAGSSQPVCTEYFARSIE